MVAATCWIPAAQLEETARLIWHARPVSYYAWSGHEHHANTTETARAMALLYALTGSFDAAGGNVLFPAVPSAPITGEDLPAAKHLAPAIGVADRPLGPARWNNVSAQDFYRAVLDGTPYPMRGLIGFGSNTLLAFSDPVRGRRALAALDFYAHVDLFMNPTAAAGRYRAAGRIILRARGAEDRLRDQRRRRNPSCSSARPWCRRPGRRGPTPTSSSISPCGSAWGTNSGAAISRPPIATSWGRAA